MKDLTPFNTHNKLLSRYAQQVQGIRTGENVYPVAMEINLSDVCGQNCKWCISDDVKDFPCQVDVESEAFKNFINDFKFHGGQCLTWSGGGEPTTHPKFLQALDLVQSAGIPQALITHGAFANKYVAAISKKCDWVRISIDTHDAQMYADMRGAKPKHFQQVVRNATDLANTGMKVGLNINVAEWNKSHIDPLYELACETGVSYLQVRPTLITPSASPEDNAYLHPQSISGILSRLETLQKNSTGNKTRLVVSHDKFIDLQNNPQQRGYKGCASHQLFVVLNCNGDLMVCMYHLFDERFVLGNIYKDSLQQVWQSLQRQQTVNFCRDTLDHTRHHCQICCKGEEINKVLFAEKFTKIDAQFDSPFI